MTRYFIVLDANEPDAAMVAKEPFDSFEAAMAYVHKYNLERRELGYEVHEGRKVWPA